MRIAGLSRQKNRLNFACRLSNHPGGLVKHALAAVLFLALSIRVAGQETSELSMPPNGDNEHADVSQWIGPVKISIDYHSPKVHNPANNDRTGHIWGELVHYLL